MRYRVSDLPPVGIGAFMPVPASTSIGLGDTVRVGYPGTLPVPTGSPLEALPALTARGHGQDSAQSSDAAPNLQLPSIYIAKADNMGPSRHFGMARRRLNELPMPALDPTRVGVNAAQPAKIGGRFQIGWPRAFQRFPTRGGANG